MERIAHIMGKWGGGVESVVMNYYRNMDRTKVQFDFLCDEDSRNIPYEEIKNLGGRIIMIPPYQNIFKYKKKLRKILEQNNYKIIHSHINTLSVFPLCEAKKVNIPVRIAHSHSTTNFIEVKHNLLKQILRVFSKRYATDYFCCSELSGRWLFGNREYDKGNVFLLNNAIDVNKFQYNEQIRKEERKKMKINDDTLVIGHLGRFVKQKNHEFLIDVFEQVHKQNNNSILILAGSGPLLDEIKQKVKKLKLENCVKFLGQVSNTNNLYQIMDVLLLPSLYEGLPVVSVEAQTSGVLCILSDEITKEAKILDTTCFVSLKENAKIWSETVLKSYNNFTRKNVKKEVSNSIFDIKSEANNLLKKYEELEACCIKNSNVL